MQRRTLGIIKTFITEGGLYFIQRYVFHTEGRLAGIHDQREAIIIKINGMDENIDDGPTLVVVLRKPRDSRQCHLVKSESIALYI